MKLADYMALHDLNDREIAEKVNCHRSMITKLRLEQAGPSMATARKIQQITKGRVTLFDWPAAQAAE